MATNYSAVIQERDGLWLGWVEEVPGVNAQAPTRDELMEDLRSALAEALEMNRADARAAAQGSYEEVSLLA
jgi:predicted RNase H-like HicB family nuclease